MRDKLSLWRLYNVSSAYGKEPADFFPELETDLAKWTLNEATLLIGRTFENAIQEGKDPFKGIQPVPTKQYASAPKRKIKKVKNLAEIGFKHGNSTR